MRMDILEIRRANLLAVLAKRKSEGKTQAELADALESSASYISQMKKGVTPSGEPVNMGTAMARKFESIENLPHGWMDQEHPVEQSEGKNQTSVVIQRYESSNVREINKKPVAIPVLSYVQAGGWREAIAVRVDEYIYSTKELSVHAFALEVSGLSMSPEFKEGDHIIVDPNIYPNPGNCVVAQNGHVEATFKKYRPRGRDLKGNEVFELVPINPDYATLRSDIEKIVIIGTVMEHHRKLR